MRVPKGGIVLVLSKREAVAVREFERTRGHCTRPCGFFVHRAFPFLAASLDRYAWFPSCCGG